MSWTLVSSKPRSRENSDNVQQMYVSNLSTYQIKPKQSTHVVRIQLHGLGKVFASMFHVVNATLSVFYLQIKVRWIHFLVGNHNRALQTVLIISVLMEKCYLIKTYIVLTQKFSAMQPIEDKDR